MNRELVRRAAELVPMLREQAAQAEALRSVPQETIDALCRADLLRAPLPERFGGLGLDFDIEDSQCFPLFSRRLLSRGCIPCL
jgi:alkylation response protein AidB-like acyl-CoA dehydrogenase